MSALATKGGPVAAAAAAPAVAAATAAATAAASALSRGLGLATEPAPLPPAPLAPAPEPAPVQGRASGLPPAHVPAGAAAAAAESASGLAHPAGRPPLYPGFVTPRPLAPLSKARLNALSRSLQHGSYLPQVIQQGRRPHPMVNGSRVRSFFIEARPPNGARGIRLNQAGLNPRVRARLANSSVTIGFNDRLFYFTVQNQGERFRDIIYAEGYGIITGSINNIIGGTYWRTAPIRQRTADEVGMEVEHITGKIIFARIFIGCRQINTGVDDRSLDARNRFFRRLANLANDVNINLTYETRATNVTLSAIDSIVHQQRISFHQAFIRYAGNNPIRRAFAVDRYIERNRNAIEGIIRSLREEIPAVIPEEDADYIALINYAIWYLERYRDVAYPGLAGGGIVDFSDYPKDIEQIITDACFDKLVFGSELAAESAAESEKTPTTIEEAKPVIDKLIKDIDKIWEIFDTEILDKITYEELNDMIRKASPSQSANKSVHGGFRKNKTINRKKMVKKTRKLGGGPLNRAGMMIGKQLMTKAAQGALKSQPLAQTAFKMAPMALGTQLGNPALRKFSTNSRPFNNPKEEIEKPKESSWTYDNFSNSEKFPTFEEVLKKRTKEQQAKDFHNIPFDLMQSHETANFARQEMNKIFPPGRPTSINPEKKAKIPTESHKEPWKPSDRAIELAGMVYGGTRRRRRHSKKYRTRKH